MRIIRVPRDDGSFGLEFVWDGGGGLDYFPNGEPVIGFMIAAPPIAAPPATKWDFVGYMYINGVKYSEYAKRNAGESIIQPASDPPPNTDPTTSSRTPTTVPDYGAKGGYSIEPPPPIYGPQPSRAAPTEKKLYREMAQSGYSPDAVRRLGEYYGDQFDWSVGNLRQVLLNRAGAFATAARGQWRNEDYLNSIANGFVASIDIAGVAMVAGDSWKETMENLATGVLIGGILGGLRVGPKATVADKGLSLGPQIDSSLSEVGPKLDSALPSTEAPSLITPYTRDSQGLTWTEPQTLNEQMARQAAGSGEGRVIMDGPFGDPRFQEPGWQKMEYKTYTADGNKIEIHYMRNMRSIDQVKFLSRGEYPKPE